MMANTDPDTDTPTPVPDALASAPSDNVYKPADSLHPPVDEAKTSLGAYVFWVIMFVLNCCPALSILVIILGISSASSGIKDVIDFIMFIFLLPLGIHKWPPTYNSI